VGAARQGILRKTHELVSFLVDDAGVKVTAAFDGR
jgi:hypothetical protein